VAGYRASITTLACDQVVSGPETIRLASGGCVKK